MFTKKNFIGKVAATETIVDTLFILGPSSKGQALIVNMVKQLSQSSIDDIAANFDSLIVYIVI